MKPLLKFSLTAAFTVAAIATLANVGKIEGSHISPPIIGWLWGGSTDDSLGLAGADTATGLGWVSVTSDNQPCTGSASDCYGVIIPTNNGPVTGYAWSPNVGWIDFQPSGPYPDQAALPGVRRNGNDLEGWARIVSIKDALAQGNSGGWQGWIKMRGTITGGGSYGVTIQSGGSSNCGTATCDSHLDGYAWSDEFGWIQFGPPNPPFPELYFGTVPPPPPPPPPPDLTVSLTAIPSSSQTAPLNDVDLTADVGGSATGPITYEFDCVANSGIDHTAANTSQDPYTWVDGCDYSSQGAYSATVRVTREGENALDSTIISVAVPFSVTCSGNAGSGNTITWRAVAQGGGGAGTYSYSWSFPLGGTPATSVSNPITVAYNSSGSKQAAVTAMSVGETVNATCSATATRFKLKEIIPFF